MWENIKKKKQYGNGKVDIFTPCFIKLDEVSLSEQVVILCIFSDFAPYQSRNRGKLGFKLFLGSQR